MLKGQGFKTWTYQKDHDARPGVQTLDLPKKIVRMIVHTVVNTIARMIVKISVHSECTNEFHVEHVQWMTDNNQTNRQWPD